ncbi:hypothetical protein [Kitasatospora sp. NPDC101183]|uniref:hypothetical protein n=1 Tax=Kitasatospora sp. NPDC101183 TaxID=3364100 RepID=UPI0037FE167B
MKTRQGILMAVVAVALAVGPFAPAAGAAPSAGSVTASTSAPPAGGRVAYDPTAKPGSRANPIVARERTDLAGCGDAGLYWCRVWSAGPGWVKLGTFLGSGHHEWATAQGIAPGHEYQVYMDRSWDGGRNWDGRLNVSYNELRWSEAVYDGPPYSTRACLWDVTDQILYCGSWH